MENIILIDDDFVQLALYKTTLSKYGYNVETYSKPHNMLDNYYPGKASLILTDLQMPEMTGTELLEEIRKKDSHTPVIIVTAGSDTDIVIKNFKLGISDFLIKPVSPEGLMYRVKKVIKETKIENALKDIEKENELIKLEHEKMVNWRELYATKDIKQTENMMSYFARSINSGLGYMWLDMLNDIEKDNDGNHIIPEDLFQLVVQSAGEQRKSFEYITYMNNLPDVDLVPCGVDLLKIYLDEYFKSTLESIITDSNRTISFNMNLNMNEGSFNLDIEILKEIILELVVNSVKFSPEESRIIIDIYKEQKSLYRGDKCDKNYVVFEIRNRGKSLNDPQVSGKKIYGIPYDYKELVFDFFFTLEPFPTTHEKEKWINGTGLYIARNFIKKMDGWIECNNIVDYTGNENVPYVQFKLSFPINMNKKGELES